MRNVIPSIQNLVQLLDLLMLTDVVGKFVRLRPAMKLLMTCYLCYMTDAHQASVLTALMFVAVMRVLGAAG